MSLALLDPAPSASVPEVFIGSHMTNWLWEVEWELFISRRTLQRRSVKGLRPAKCRRWALDSGGFTELAMHGRWTMSAAAYAELVHIYDELIGNLAWVAPQDWMCEPFMVERTGLSVREHQERTVANFLELRRLLGKKVKPVLQGDVPAAYRRCYDLYLQAGVDLTKESLVGLGSVCRRQSTNEITSLVRELSSLGLRLHGFGVKTQGLNRYGALLTSVDSLAWSYRARRSAPLPSCTGHRSCANCLIYATRYRTRLLRSLHTRQLAATAAYQLPLWN